jgi:hypothetical protein
MTERHGLHTYGGLLSHWHDTNYTTLRFIVGIITQLLLGTYAAAQLSAGRLLAIRAFSPWCWTPGVYSEPDSLHYSLSTSDQARHLRSPCCSVA